MEDITPSFLGVTKALPLLQCVVKETRLPSIQGPLVSTDLYEDHPTSIINPQPFKSYFYDLLPNQVEANILFQNYLDRVITQYPIYHRDDVTTAFNSIFHQKVSNLEQDSPRNRYIVCIIMAISLSTAARSHLKKAGETAYQLVRHAMQLIPVVATNDIAGLQAMLLLTQYIFLNPRMADLWLLTGLISQSVIDLGLHQELPNDSRVSMYQRDMRRRLFWCAWEMEVGVCSIFLRPTSLPIRRIDVVFPVEIDDTAITQYGMELTGRVSKFAQRIICRFRLIEAEIISILWHGDPIPSEYSSVEQWMQHCVTAISTWQQEIYTAAKLNKDHGLVARWDEMILYSDISVPYILFTLYRPSHRIPVPNISQMMIAVVNAVKVADGYFRQLEAEAGRIKYVFHSCHHVFNCALVFLQGLQRCKRELSQAYSWGDIEAWMHMFSKCFSRIAERWTASERCLEEYERLLPPIRNDYMEFLGHKGSLLSLSSSAPIVPGGGLHDYSTSVPNPAPGPAPAPVKIDEGISLWSEFNLTREAETTETPSPLAFNAPPRDWNAEFSLKYGV